MSDLNNMIADLNMFVRELDDLKAKIKVLGWENRGSSDMYSFLSAEDDIRSATMHLRLAVKSLMLEDEVV